MHYREIKPGHRLTRYVKCYYIYESHSEAAFEDTVFPSGQMEIIFNLGSGHWHTASGDAFVTHPSIELWGQLAGPLPVRSTGKNTMLGVRLFPHAAACFLNNNNADLFTNQVVDFRAVTGKVADTLYAQLQDTADWPARIALVESFLLDKLNLAEKQLTRTTVVGDIMQELQQEDFFDNIENVASRYGFTSRYLQKLFLQYTGLTPKLYSKINRFQNSLRLVTKKEASLTSIAYDCGYFDQSHFIREFKSFTGLTPSGYSIDNSPVTLALASN